VRLSAPSGGNDGSSRLSHGADDLDKQRERLYGSPRRKRQRIDADRYGGCPPTQRFNDADLKPRFIPARSGRDLQSGFQLIPPPPRQAPERGRARSPPRGYRSQRSKWSRRTGLLHRADRSGRRGSGSDFQGLATRRAV
jgi:cell division cycle 20-like protein 1 (cofactor of APC complex)